MSAELKCPWCGDGVFFSDTFGSGEWGWECYSCGAAGPWRPTREEAIATMAQVVSDEYDDDTLDTGAAQDGPSLHDIVQALRAQVRTLKYVAGKQRERAEKAEAEARRLTCLTIHDGDGNPVSQGAYNALSSAYYAQLEAHKDKKKAEAELRELREAIDAMADSEDDLSARWFHDGASGSYCCIVDSGNCDPPGTDDAHEHTSAADAVLAWWRECKR